MAGGAGGGGPAGDGGGGLGAGAVPGSDVAESVLPVLVGVAGAVVGGFREVRAVVPPVPSAAALLLPPRGGVPPAAPPAAAAARLVLHVQGLVRRDGLHQGTRVGLGLAVQGDESEGDDDAGQEEEEAPPHAGPDAVEGVDDLVADGDDGGVVAVAERLAPPDAAPGPVDHSLDVRVDEGHRLVDVLVRQLVHQLRALLPEEAGGLGGLLDQAAEGLAQVGLGVSCLPLQRPDRVVQLADGQLHVHHHPLHLVQEERLVLDGRTDQARLLPPQPLPHLAEPPGEGAQVDGGDLLLQQLGVLREVEVGDLGLCQLAQLRLCLRGEDLDAAEVLQADLALEVGDEVADAVLLPPPPQLRDVVHVLHAEDLVDGEVAVAVGDELADGHGAPPLVGLLLLQHGLHQPAVQQLEDVGVVGPLEGVADHLVGGGAHQELGGGHHQEDEGEEEGEVDGGQQPVGARPGVAAVVSVGVVRPLAAEAVEEPEDVADEDEQEHEGHAQPDVEVVLAVLLQPRLQRGRLRPHRRHVAVQLVEEALDLGGLVAQLVPHAADLGLDLGPDVADGPLDVHLDPVQLLLPAPDLALDVVLHQLRDVLHEEAEVRQAGGQLAEVGGDGKVSRDVVLGEEVLAHLAGAALTERREQPRAGAVQAQPQLPDELLQVLRLGLDLLEPPLGVAQVGDDVGEVVDGHGLGHLRQAALEDGAALVQDTVQHDLQLVKVGHQEGVDLLAGVAQVEAGVLGGGLQSLRQLLHPLVAEVVGDEGADDAEHGGDDGGRQEDPQREALAGVAPLVEVLRVGPALSGAAAAPHAAAGHGHGRRQQQPAGGHRQHPHVVQRQLLPLGAQHARHPLRRRLHQL